MAELTLEQIESVLVDAGVVYIDYNETTERLLAPTRGGNTFAVEREVRVIEVDGIRGKVKGLRRIVAENATLTVRLMGLTQENLALALPGATVDGAVISGGVGNIASTDYLANVTLIGENMAGETKVITLFNALADGNLSLSMTPKEEGVIELTLSAHYDPEDQDAPIYTIEDVEASGTHTVTFTVDDGSDEIEGATVIFAGRSRTTDSSGVAAFTGVAEGTNRPYEIRASGFQTYFGSVTVDGDEAVAPSMTAV